MWPLEEVEVVDTVADIGWLLDANLSLCCGTIRWLAYAARVQSSVLHGAYHPGHFHGQSWSFDLARVQTWTQIMQSPRN